MREQSDTLGEIVREVSPEWVGVDVATYLDRCQIDTPPRLVAATWERARRARTAVGRVVDFGAGKGQFAHGGPYRSYTGYELDYSRTRGAKLPDGATIRHGCAFSAKIPEADLCIGNPPFVRNQDLPQGWRTQVGGTLEVRSGITLSGLANAWQYFFLLGLLSTKRNGLCALVIPFEWVSRPSAARLRDFIHARNWRVDVYRLDGEAFGSVLTTASITIVDKRARDGRWRYFATGMDGVDRELPTPSGHAEGHLAYRSRRRDDGPVAVRGLSPGTQKVMVLTEGERARLGLRTGADVVRCVTTLRTLPSETEDLDAVAFDRHFRSAGRRCWLIRPDAAVPGSRLRAYLDAVDPGSYATKTCEAREAWWGFQMPAQPTALVATCFKGATPKTVLNSVGAIAVGGVAGLHRAQAEWAADFLGHLSRLDLRDRIISHANGLKKIEIGQLNTLIAGHHVDERG